MTLVVKLGCCPVSERLAKQLSKKNSASFELTGKPQWENFCLANRSLTGHGPDDISREQFACDLKTFLCAWAGPIRQRRPTEHLFKRRFINGLTYLLTYYLYSRAVNTGSVYRRLVSYRVSGYDAALVALHIQRSWNTR